MNSKLGAGALVNCLGIVWMPACLYPLPIKGHSPVTPIQLPNYSSSPYLTKCLFVIKLMLLQNAIPNVNIQMWILVFFLNPPQELLSWPCLKSYILLKRNFLDWFFCLFFVPWLIFLDWSCWQHLYMEPEHQVLHPVKVHISFHI